jgi:hypothetical protein
MPRTILSGLAVLLALSAGAAAEVPNLPIDVHCATVQKRTGAPDTMREACIRDETDARAQLAAGIWDKAKAQTRESCRPNPIAGQNVSYMEVLGCVQLMEGVVLRPADQQGKAPTQP